ncbi:MAG: S1 family peptidase [Firmicutes bacterium]|nr:S1 family peptidase [Bacillota bacterium]
MYKATISLFFVVCLLFGMSTLVFASDADRDIDELISIVQDLIMQRDAANPLGADSRLPENLHLHPGFYNAIFVNEGYYDAILFSRTPRQITYHDALEAGFDARFALLREVVCLINDTLAIQARDRGFEPEPALVMWGGPTPCLPYFQVWFSCDEFLPLVDVILYFVGIPKGMLRIGPSIPHDTFWSGPEIIVTYLDDIDDKYTCIDIEPFNVSRIQMGSMLNITWRVDNRQYAAPATLGHPRNAMGRTVFTTNHGFIPIDAAVYRVFTGQRIGYVANRVYNRHTGADVSYVWLSTINISPEIPSLHNPGRNITNFNAPRPGIGQRVSIISGRTPMHLLEDSSVVASSRDVIVNGTIFHNVILVRASAQSGDSGSAVIHGTNVVGTLFGGNATYAFISFVGSYINIGIGGFSIPLSEYQNCDFWYYYKYKTEQ